MKKHYKSIKLQFAYNTLIFRGIRLWMGMVMVVAGSAMGVAEVGVDDPIKREIYVDVLLEGLYDSNLRQMRKVHDFVDGVPTAFYDGDVADQVTVSLHEVEDYSVHTWGSLKRYGAQVPISQEGRAVLALPDQVHGAAIDGSYWLSVNHRNHLEVIFHEPIEISGEGPFLYDLITGGPPEIGNSAFGNNLHYVGINEADGESKHVWAMYAGDITGDGNIFIIDNSRFRQALFSGKRGLTPEDLNGDGVVNIVDRSILEKNLSKRLILERPRN